MNERQKEILDILYQNGKVSVADLSKTLFVTEMTVRRDLIEMEKGGFLRRYRGGAVLKINVGEMPISERLLWDSREKEALARKCTEYLSDGITVFIDSSSTCQYIIPYLSEYKNITVITNSISALLTLGKLHIFCILIGREYYEQDMCTVGSLAEHYVKELNVDIAFFTTAAISYDGVISDFDLKQTAIRKLVMKNANKNIFLFEKEKFGKKSLYTLCTTEDATAILTANEEQKDL
ncbi:MAG: DeoR/GlpR transcriptional regulator [Clostridia bacterium]|nr:DeoR/GlpR transcriptional regulator [Clostridia bacterium]